MPELFIVELVRELIILALMGLLYYLACAMTIIGLAMMLGGPAWAQEAATFCIGTPFVGLCRLLAHLVVAVVSGLVSAIIWFVEGIFTNVIDPLLRGFARLIRLTFTGHP